METRAALSDDNKNRQMNFSWLWQNVVQRDPKRAIRTETDAISQLFQEFQRVKKICPDSAG